MWLWIQGEYFVAQPQGADEPRASLRIHLPIGGWGRLVLRNCGPDDRVDVLELVEERRAGKVWADKTSVIFRTKKPHFTTDVLRIAGENLTRPKPLLLIPLTYSSLFENLIF